MVISQLQERVQALLTRRGFTDPSGNAGFEVVRDDRGGRGMQGLAIRSAAEAKVQPFTGWQYENVLVTIRVGGDQLKEPTITSWEDRAFPFLWMPQSVDASGIEPTVKILDRAFKSLSQKLTAQLLKIADVEVTAAERATLAAVYFATGRSRILASTDTEKYFRVSSYGIEWAAEGVRADILLYALADDAVYGSKRAHSEPLFSLEEAKELTQAKVSLRTIASLYPVADIYEPVPAWI